MNRHREALGATRTLLTAHCTVTRRALLHTAGGIAFASCCPGGAVFAETFTRRIPQAPSARVIVDNDLGGDPDGLVALAHQLLTPKTKTVLITTTALDPRSGKARAAAAREVAQELMRRLEIEPAPPVEVGAETPATGASPAAKAIVSEAMRDDPLPLFLTCGGPLTNVAAALLLAPKIAQRMTLVWIGGGAYPHGGWEYNLAMDVDAARHVIEHTDVPLWQVPQSTYRLMEYSIAEMTADLRPISPFTEWLYDRFTSPPDFIKLGGTWPLGDSPLVLVTALSTESSSYVNRAARRIEADLHYGAEIPGRSVRVFESVDARLVFADFLALLRLHANKGVSSVSPPLQRGDQSRSS